jgi:peptidoglycan/xylan/chitin deacetylase (PgdA/CDA1 family)
VIRKLGLAAVILLASCATPQQQRAPEIAITIDDLPVHGPYPAGETPQSVARGLIAALTAAHAPAYGFIKGHWVAERPDTAQVFTMWRSAGLSLGNHGWSHRHLSEMTPAEFEQELVRNEPILGREDWHSVPLSLPRRRLEVTEACSGSRDPCEARLRGCDGHDGFR